jgi:DNA repair protein REV1
MGSLLDKNSKSVLKRIENHTFENEEGDEYGGSKFGGFGDYFRRKKIKLQNLDAEVRSSSDGNPQIFRGIVAHVNGYTQPSLNDLHHLIVSHGGGFMQYLDGKTTVTHIIAANLTPKKAVEFRRYRIVKPAWIVDSVKAGKLLPWDEYRELDEGPGQRRLGFDHGKMVNQVNTQQRGYRDQMNTSWYTNQVKGIAEDMEDKRGHQVRSARPAALIRTIMDDSPDGQVMKTVEVTTPEQTCDNSQLSGSFEITSSLEDALQQAANLESAREVKLEPNLNRFPNFEGEPSKLVASRNLQEDEYEEGSTDVKSSSKVGDSSILLKHSHEIEALSPSKKAKVITAEEHNAMLLADPHIRKSSTANPNFIQQFYSESRLHHLSMWKAGLKAQLQQMAAEKTASQKLTKRKIGLRSYIMHVDFDCFFCAVSLKNAPEFCDKPAVVAHGSGAGSEIASCNYPARAFGVKNGMWMKQALVLCPIIKVLPYDFPAYEEASKGFYEAILDVGGIVQSVSVDEALVDISTLCLSAGGSGEIGVSEGSTRMEQEKAGRIAQELRKRIKQKTGCEVSIGIGGNILLAKVALRKAKPAGQYQIRPEGVLDVLGDLTVQGLPGVAYSIGGKLEEAGVKLVKDIRRLTKERLITLLGPKTGEKIWDYSRGIDKTELGEQVVRKSVSAEVNWGIRFISQPEAEEFVHNLCLELQRRLVEQKVKGRQLTMKIMKKAADAPLDPPKHLGHGECDTFTKSVGFWVATNSADITGREAVLILRGYGFSPGEIRGLGVQMTKLEPLKASDGFADGSQRKIDFGKATAPKLSKQSDDPIDDPETPKKANITFTTSRRWNVESPIDGSTASRSRTIVSPFLDNDDPIDDMKSPKKEYAARVHPATAISRANNSDQTAKILNLTGTQFFLPSQIDPTALAELPQELRSKLMAQSKSMPGSRDSTPGIKSRSESPATQYAMPLPSQIDPEVFEALPEGMKAEIVASYSAQGNTRHQKLLPQSPRKNKLLPTKKWTPIKKRGRPVGAKNKKDDPFSPTLTQSNFILGEPTDTLAETEDSDVLDPEFLAALPDEMRLEVVAENRQKRLAKRGGLMASTLKKRLHPEPPQLGQRKLTLPKREPRPTFTTKALWKEDELRGTIKLWHAEFRDEGPHIEDVQALERYLRRVVIDERDLAKVRGVVRWLAWLVNEDEAGRHGQMKWRGVLEGIKDSVQLAVKERGLAMLEL